MRFLLDTNVVSELRKASRCDCSVASWAETVPLKQQYLSVITIFEIRLGIELKRHRDEKAGTALFEWYQNQVLPSFHERIIPVTEDIAQDAALFHVPVSRPFRDSLIAATAKQHALIIVTRNVKDFQTFNLPIINPWSYTFSPTVCEK